MPCMCKAKNANCPCTIIADSLQHYYAGYTQDVKNVMQALDVEYKDAVGTNVWSVVNSKY